LKSSTCSSITYRSNSVIAVSRRDVSIVTSAARPDHLNGVDQAARRLDRPYAFVTFAADAGITHSTSSSPKPCWRSPVARVGRRVSL
jgi:hypothetical protein